MANRFKIGDVAIYCRPGSLNYGAEVIITGSLKLKRLWLAPNDYYIAKAYTVSGSFKGMWSKMDACAEPRHLRRKGAPLPPNRDETGEWDECPWQPSQVTVTERNNG